jgi:predicted RNase H-like nuclease
MNNFPIAGIDGCPGGWIVVGRERPGGPAKIERIERIERLFERGGSPNVVAIDIPIGLPERTGPKGRTPERLVRSYLGERQSSVFSIASRAAVYAGVDPAIPEADRYRRASALARATSEEQKAIAKQAFHIFPKIVEVDAFLRLRADLVPRFYECHPEVAFWAMNGERALTEPKKVRGRSYAPGLDRRRRLLAAEGFDEAMMSEELARALKAGADDLIDACAACWSAARIATGKAISFPDPPERDAFGLPIAIWA